MSRLVTLLNTAEVEIFFISTHENPSDWLSRTHEFEETGSEIKDHELRTTSKKGEEVETKGMEKLLFKGKAGDKWKETMSLPEVNEQGEISNLKQEEEYEKLSLDNLAKKVQQTNQVTRWRKKETKMMYNDNHIEELIGDVIRGWVEKDGMGARINTVQTIGSDLDDYITNKSEIIGKQRSDPYLMKIIEELEEGELKQFNLERTPMEEEEAKEKKVKRGNTTFKLKEGVLIGSPENRTEGDFKYIVPTNFTRDLVYLRHNLSHHGRDKMEFELRKMFLWGSDTNNSESISETVKFIVESCLECQIFNKKPRSPYRRIFGILHAAQQSGCGKVAMLDYFSIGKMPGSEYKALLGSICVRCRLVHTQPVKKESAETTANFILKEICQPLIPSRILSDNGMTVTAGAIPFLVEAVNSGLNNYFRKGMINPEKQATHGDENRDLEEALLLIQNPVPEENEGKSKEERERLEELKQRIAETERRNRHLKREKLQEDNWKQLHRNEDTKRLEHGKSSAYRACSHALIERYWSSFANVLRRLTTDEPKKWHKYTYHITTHYNNSFHKALRGLSPTSLHYNLDPQQVTHDIYSILELANTNHPFCLEEMELSRRARVILQKSKQDRYFQSADKKTIERYPPSPEDAIRPVEGDIVMSRRLVNLDKFSTCGWLTGPAMVVDRPSEQQLEILFLQNGVTSIKHESHLCLSLIHI